MAQLSVHLANFAEDPVGWGPLIELAHTAEDVGIDRVVVSDHVVFGEELEAYARPEVGGTTGGRQPTGPDGHWLEPLILLAHLAGVTERVRLATSILIAPLRRPAVLAKQLATLDVLSAGRVDLGVGIGWQREEYEACGLDFDRRGRLLDECLEICHLLWTQPVASYLSTDETSPNRSFDLIHQMPKPVQASQLDIGGLPVWVGGRLMPNTVRRIVSFGHGWIPWGDHIDDPGPGIAVLQEAFIEAGRDPAVLQVEGRLVPQRSDDGSLDIDATLDRAMGLIELGITDLRVQGRWGRDRQRDSDELGAIVESVRARTTSI